METHVGSKEIRQKEMRSIVHGMRLRSSAMLPFVTGKHETSADEGPERGAIETLGGKTSEEVCKTSSRCSDGFCYAVIVRGKSRRADAREKVARCDACSLDKQCNHASVPTLRKRIF
jgi:hypothetical protein